MSDKTNVVNMNVKTIATYLGLTRSTKYKWVESGFIPHKKLGKRLLFIKTEIDQWVLNNGMMVEDLPEVPKFLTLRTDPPEEIQNRAKDLNPQTKELGNINFKYRRAG
jgi:excisionase family DNA binding protein